MSETTILRSLFSKLCGKYGVGILHGYEPILGGTVHKTWKLTTSQGTYALRQLNTHLLELQNKSLNFFNQAEQVAASMQAHGIPAVVALQYAESYVLEMDGQHFMLFPWINGKCVADAEITVTQAAKMGEMLAKIHGLQLAPTDIELFHWQAFTAAHWQNLFTQAKENKCPWYPEIATMLPDLLAWSDLVAQALPVLKKNRVLSHRDLNSFNVLWQNEQSPMIIDWEFSGYINPALELFIVAINWSRVGTTCIDQARYQAVLAAYRAQSNYDSSISLDIVHGYLGYCMDWLEFNLRRALAWPKDEIAVQEILTTYRVVKYVSLQTWL